MTNAARQAELRISRAVHADIAMGPMIDTITGEIERERRLPQSMVSILRREGIFSMAMLRAWGGARTRQDPMIEFPVIEALAKLR
jgi:hypothetical protein